MNATRIRWRCWRDGLYGAAIAGTITTTDGRRYELCANFGRSTGRRRDAVTRAMRQHIFRDMHRDATRKTLVEAT